MVSIGEMSNITRLCSVYETKFAEEQRAVTAGQSVVWYDGDKLLGGGVIDSSDVSDIEDFVL